MKKMILGGLLFFCGFIGVLALVCISVFKPYDYNGIVGVGGFLLGSGTELFFYFCCFLTVVGIILCINEVYGKWWNWKS